MEVAQPAVSVAIPTYRRGAILLETVERLLAADPPPVELLIVDQDPTHDPEVSDRLRTLDGAGAIRWIRLEAPSIPGAMNEALARASHEIVLFLDDDIEPAGDLVAKHLSAHLRFEPDLVAGKVIQPWHESEAFDVEAEADWVEEFMGGNFSVRRRKALDLGGFDRNFVRAAYRFEAEFAGRLRRAGGRILYEPRAVIRHLKAGSGGTREYGLHYRTLRPDHSVGEYYFLLRGWEVEGRLRRLLRRPFRSVRTRYHLKHPWWIPLTFASEVAGLAWASALAIRGPRFATAPEEARA